MEAYNTNTSTIDRDLLLFVAGFPSKIHPAASYGLFSKASPVREFKLGKVKFGIDLQPVSSSNDLPTGFYILAPLIADTYKKILDHGLTTFFGRSLYITSFKERSPYTKQPENKIPT